MPVQILKVVRQHSILNDVPYGKNNKMTKKVSHYSTASMNCWCHPFEHGIAVVQWAVQWHRSTAQHGRAFDSFTSNLSESISTSIRIEGLWGVLRTIVSDHHFWNSASCKHEVSITGMYVCHVAIQVHGLGYKSHWQLLASPFLLFKPFLHTLQQSYSAQHRRSTQTVPLCRHTFLALRCVWYRCYK